MSIHDGRVVTFWRHLDSAGRPPDFVDLAAMLSALHDLVKPVHLVLPLFDPLAHVEDR
jgi:hypothetical protein